MRFYPFIKISKRYVRDWLFTIHKSHDIKFRFWTDLSGLHI
jgi:hypothetical protein